MRRLVIFFAKILARIGVLEDFFHGIIAAHAVGEGSDAYKHGRYEHALTVLKPVADLTLDDPYVGSAQYIVGLLYLHGLGVERSVQQAHYYFQRAAERGNADADKYLRTDQ